MKAIDPGRLGAARVRAPNCEGAHCCDPNGEVRVYRLLFEAHVILCRPCWEQENDYRKERASELRCPEHWPMYDWDTAECYQSLSLCDGSAKTRAVSLESALSS